MPLIFVIKNSDNPSIKYDDKSEFVLNHISRKAVNYGATIIYTSTKKKYNIKASCDCIFHFYINSN